MDFPRILISALRGGSGKTILSIGIIAAWKSFGRQITPFKKGPDYIDAGWLALAAGRPCYNLDTFLTQKAHILQSFFFHSITGDIAVIEGNRGLYDGIDVQGSTSTAELAKLLQTPVILCIDCTKSTRTMAAAVLGCMTFDPDTQIKGVILNRVAGPRHEKVLLKNIEYHCDIPVLGAVPKLDWQSFPERHMGLLPTPEHGWAKDSIQAASQLAGRYLDLEALAAVADDAGPLPVSAALQEGILAETKSSLNSDPQLRPIIGIIKDSAFQFYYPENIEAIGAAGAAVPITSRAMPSSPAFCWANIISSWYCSSCSSNRRLSEMDKPLAVATCSARCP